MKKLLGMIAVALVLSACQVQQNIETNTTEMDEIESENKVGDTTLSGKVVKTGETFSLVDEGGKRTEIDSYGVDLSGYIDQEVSVTGQYSGDTLFVAKVE